MKTFAAALLILGMAMSSGILSNSAHAASGRVDWNKTTVTGDAAG